MPNKEEIDKRIDEFKEEHLHLVVKLMQNFAFLPPQLSVLVYNNTDSKFTVENYDVPPEYLESETGKNLFLHVMGLILGKLEDSKQTPICIAWSTEAWIRKSENTEGIPKNWKDLPKEEGVLNYFESEDNSFIVAYNTIREGSRVNEHGDIIDDIRLELNTEISENKSLTPIEGRFSNLFKKYRKTYNR